MLEIRIKRSNKALLVELLSIIFPLTLLYLGILVFIFFIFSLKISTIILAFVTIATSVVYICVVLQLIISKKLIWRTKEYVINKDRVIVMDGIIGSRERINNLKGLTNMQFYQDALGKHFNYGTITLYFLGGGEVNFRDIDTPHLYMKNIQSLIDNGYYPR